MAVDFDRRFAYARRRVHDAIDARCSTAHAQASSDAAITRRWLHSLITFYRRSIAQQRSWRTVRRLPKEV